MGCGKPHISSRVPVESGKSAFEDQIAYIDVELSFERLCAENESPGRERMQIIAALQRLGVPTGEWPVRRFAQDPEAQREYRGVIFHGTSVSTARLRTIARIPGTMVEEIRRAMP